MVAYNYAFEFDLAKHKGFSKASRHVWSDAKGGPAPIITKEQEALLRLGLAAFDMDYRVCPGANNDVGYADGWLATAVDG